jgi:hypothetical protein
MDRFQELGFLFFLFVEFLEAEVVLFAFLADGGA